MWARKGEGSRSGEVDEGKNRHGRRRTRPPLPPAPLQDEEWWEVEVDIPNIAVAMNFVFNYYEHYVSVRGRCGCECVCGGGGCMWRYGTGGNAGWRQAGVGPPHHPHKLAPIPKRTSRTFHSPTHPLVIMHVTPLHTAVPPRLPTVYHFLS